MQLDLWQALNDLFAERLGGQALETGARAIWQNDVRRSPVACDLREPGGDISRFDVDNGCPEIDGIVDSLAQVALPIE